MLLRRLEEKDLPFLLEVRNDESTRFYLENNSIFSLDECKDWFNKNNPNWFIIEVDNEPVGYFRTNADEVGADIHPKFRRNGYARQAYKLYLKNKKYARLWVFEDNFAKNLYEQLGFKENGNKKFVRDRVYVEMEYKKLKIGINLVGVSFNDGSNGRYRNYKDALNGLYTNIVNPLREEGHEVVFYLFTYDSIEKENILKTYTPVIKSTFLDTNYNKLGGGDVVSNGLKIISLTYISSLEKLIDEDLDLVISTRYDINFLKNPFKEYKYDFDKCNFLWREPEFMDLPIVNDTFIVFPHHMTQNLINSIIKMETNPHMGVGIAMHNIYLPMVDEVGKERVQWVSDNFETSITNNLYKLMRHE